MSETTETPTIDPSALAQNSDPLVQRYVAWFEDLEKRERGNVPPWFTAQRNEGIAHFAEMGFPHTKDEEYIFTPLTSIKEHEPNPVWSLPAGKVKPEDFARYTLKGMAHSELVFVDGHYDPNLSTIGAKTKGLFVANMAAALRENDKSLEPYLAKCACACCNPFCALNSALYTDGAYIHFEKNAVVSEPIHLLFITTDAVSTMPRVLIVGDEHSNGVVFETYITLGEHKTFTNAVTEAVVKQGANIKHVKLQDESRESTHVSICQPELERDSRLVSHTINLGAALCRNDIKFVLHGEGIDCLLNGLYLPDGDQLHDHHSTVDHKVPNSESHEYMHMVLNDKARGVFNGKRFVRRNAQKTDAKQSARAVLLSRDSKFTPKVNLKPQLEIWADDVQCTHGATVGALEESAIFYLRARGISKDNARRMLTEAFANEIVDNIAHNAIRDHIHGFVLDKLHTW